jgi:UDP-2,4-diacetamido-2,4,6-trideoxy-beta-L-altropyranose hydrolase
LIRDSVQRAAIFFRADGNAQIGMGHVMRCIAMGQMLREDFNLHFAIQQPDETTQNLLLREGFVVHTLPVSTDVEVDLRNFTQLFTQKEKVVLDGYQFQEKYQRALKPLTAQLVYIDDLLAWPQVADVVINHAGGVEVEEYMAEPQVRLCLGPGYALLRQDFFQPFSENLFIPKVFNKILINFGGADPINLTYQVAKTLLAQQDVERERRLTVVVGPSYLFLEKLRTLVKETERVAIVQNLSAQAMRDTIAAQDLCLVSCSTISYEVAQLNKCQVVFQTADNQARLAAFHQKSGTALAVLPAEYAEEELYHFLQSNPSQKEHTLRAQRQFFDGLAPNRIRQIFQT